MLKGISPLLTPELLYAMAAMGHGDSLVLADANFPAYRIAGDHTLVNLPGVGIPQLLEPMLDLFPIDHLHQAAGYVMEVSAEDRKAGVTTPIWQEFSALLERKSNRGTLAPIERQEFYKTAQDCRLVILTGEKALYGNLILYKGVL